MIATDLYNLDSLLSEEQKLIRDTVKTWVNQSIKPVIEDCFVNGKSLEGLASDLAEIALLDSFFQKNMVG